MDVSGGGVEIRTEVITQVSNPTRERSRSGEKGEGKRKKRGGRGGGRHTRYAGHLNFSIKKLNSPSVSSSHRKRRGLVDMVILSATCLSLSC